MATGTTHDSASSAHGGWHLKREIQLGHIITTVTVAASVAIYVSKIEQRVALLEAAVQTQRERDEKQDRHAQEFAHLLSQRLDRFEAKLDRLVERGK